MGVSGWVVAQALGGVVVLPEIWPPLRWWPLGQATQRGGAEEGWGPRNLQLGHSDDAACPVPGRWKVSRPGGKALEWRRADGEVELLSQMAGSFWVSVSPRTKWKG